MAQEISAAGYQDLRDYIEANWKWIELRNASQAAVIRISTADARVKWIHGAGAQELQLEATISGADADITLPVTFASSALYKVSAGGSVLNANTFTSAILDTALDKIVIVHKVQVPQI